MRRGLKYGRICLRFLFATRSTRSADFGNHSKILVQKFMKNFNKLSEKVGVKLNRFNVGLSIFFDEIGHINFFFGAKEKYLFVFHEDAVIDLEFFLF